MTAMTAMTVARACARAREVTPGAGVAGRGVRGVRDHRPRARDYVRESGAAMSDQARLATGRTESPSLEVTDGRRRGGDA
jgi:hypothetical protein